MLDYFVVVTAKTKRIEFRKAQPNLQRFEVKNFYKKMRPF